MDITAIQWATGINYILSVIILVKNFSIMKRIKKEREEEIKQVTKLLKCLKEREKVN